MHRGAWWVYSPWGCAESGLTENILSFLQQNNLGTQLIQPAIYIVLYCNGFIILFTQIIHKKQIQKIKTNIFYLTVQYLEKYRSPVHQLVFLISTRYIAAVFILAFRHPELEIKIVRLYCIEYCTVKYAKGQPLVEDACV